MLTDVGVIRDHNEDSAYADPDGDFFIVADGMGGHAAGEVASKMAVEAVTEALEGARDEIGNFARGPTDQGRRSLVSALENAVRQAHQSVFQRGAAETDKQGMGTTLDVVLIAGSEAFVAHVGDSRTYLVRDHRAAQITTDHTVAEVLVIEGKLSIEEAQISPLRTILVNAIGVAPDVGVEMAHVRLRPGDRLLLCSDGLHDYFPLEQEVSDYVSDNDPDEAIFKMVTVAKNRGGHDNITGIVLEVLETKDVAVPEDGDDDLEAPRRVGYEDTGNMPAVADGEAVPDEISRDDTAPVSERGTEPGRGPIAGNGAPAGDKSADKPEKSADKPADKSASKSDARDSDPAARTAGKAAAKDKAPVDKSASEDADGDDEPAAAGDASGDADDSDDDAEASGKKGRRARGKPDPKGRGNRDRKDAGPAGAPSPIETADTDELPAEPGDDGARAPRSRSE
ncbi:MAG TPA: protein phosphatase 2C domain-containing protein [Kofleriaceae bacterium]|nr:protein phosphatase 2C domain-containing protein [Kofleriaceae bacterium]